jgi:hypothetical protein
LSAQLTCARDLLLSRNVERFQGGLVFKAYEWLNYSTLDSTVIKKKTEGVDAPQPRYQLVRTPNLHPPLFGASTEFFGGEVLVVN